ncbi:ankyrin repeat domain-containing protein SOWAHB [Pygocentrus nattereri]|uniref:ankyrin repeat domain-containing protein SOWAHB n=1 Tax=Pygocentrus nattereri TaxID=42514 RepID=UPI0008144C5B|nr:ankyrin repeat domain-containing protein SOWAHB [Pygocentrus nattereri]
MFLCQVSGAGGAVVTRRGGAPGSRLHSSTLHGERRRRGETLGRRRRAMATDFNQDSVLRFLLGRGGSARNAELLTHFTRFLREEEDERARARNRELFKRYVNGVATVVKRDGGVSYVVLKRRYQQRLGDAAKPSSRGRGEESAPRRGEAPTQRKPLRNAAPDTPGVLPAAGIVNDNNNDVEAVNLERSVRRPSPPARARDAPRFSPDSKRSSGSGHSSEEWKGPVETHNSVYSARPGQLREVEGFGQTSPRAPFQEVSLTPPLLDGPILYESCDEPYEGPEPSPWPFPIPLGQSQISASSPCLADIPGAVSSLQPCRQGGLSQSNDSFLTPNRFGQFYIDEEENYEATEVPINPAHQRRGLPSQTLHPPELSQYQGLCSSQNSLPLPSSADSDWPRVLLRDSWSSEDVRNYQGVILEGGEQVRNTVRHSHEAELLSQFHRPERLVTPWHHSTGHLDEEPRAPAPGSMPEEGARLGPVARRLSHRMQSRMCRSLGSDLDQAFREGSDSSRLKRLHRISSFLSVTSISSSRTHSTLDGLSSAGSTRSLGHDSMSFSSRHSQVPLEPREHEWFVKAASGNWSDIYALFREDHNLLNKRDIISGYTVLHWIAKHGDHRVLNTLSYGVSKAGMTLDVDAKSACGYTPLHLAAIHSHKSFLRVLVHKFKANVALRDSSGKKPWQYLEKCDDWDLLELLGAPRRTSGGGAGGQWSAEKPPVLSSAPSAATVKRHSSLAALFKHKSHLRISANSETFL